MKTIYVAMLILSLALILSSSASAVIYYQEDFDVGYTDGNSLIGETDPRGNTWQTFDLFPGTFNELKSSSQGGQDETLGGGSGGAVGEHGAKISLGQKITSGIITIDYDIHIGPSNKRDGPQWWLHDADTDISLSVSFDGMDNTSLGFPVESGFHDPNDTNNPTSQLPNLLWEPDAGHPTEDIHGFYLVDLDNKTVFYRMSSLEEDSVATGFTPYTKTWEPNELYFYMGDVASGKGTGYDNICIASGVGECTSYIPPDRPTDFTWDSANSGDWNAATNWSSGGPPGGPLTVRRSSHTATFGDAIGSESRTVYTDTAVTVNSISFNNTMGGSYRISGGPSINVNATTGGVTPSLAVDAGSHQFQVAFGIHADTTANIAGGASVEFINRLHLNGNTLTKTGDGTLLINNRFNTGSGTIVGLGGRISGGGTVGGSLENTSGTVAPGNSSGILKVDGNYTQGSGAILAMEIEGSAGPGEDGHDQLAVTGTASVDGTLDVTPIGAYTDPAVRGTSDSFTLLTSAGLSGTFATVKYDGATLASEHVDNGLFRKVTYTANDVVFTNLLALEGDTEGDSDVDITDFNNLAVNYLSANVEWPDGNFDDDTDVDLTDFNLLAGNFGIEHSTGPGQVPEPTALFLAAIGLAGLLGLLRRKR